MFLVVIWPSAARSTIYRMEWFLDSGCTDHIINNENYFVESNKFENPINVKIGDGQGQKATSVGNVITKFVTNYNETEVELKDVFFVKEMDRDLMSFGKFTDKAKIVSIENTSKIYTHENKLIVAANNSK